jgi:redox-sensitive bicupin YhaK (pirin superfamily)
VYLDITLNAGARYEATLPAGHSAFAYVFEREVAVGPADDSVELVRGQLAVLGTGERVELKGGPEGGRLIVVAGRPLKEPVARYGPFVMNTEAEIRQAFVDFQSGRF